MVKIERDLLASMLALTAKGMATTLSMPETVKLSINMLEIKNILEAYDNGEQATKKPLFIQQKLF